MDEKKIIKINTEHFKFPDKSTRKKKESTAPIRVRTSQGTTYSHSKNHTLRKNVMKMIRDKQQEEYKKLFEDHSPLAEGVKSLQDVSEFDKDFEHSLEYFSDLTKKTEEKQKNHTLKHHSPISNPAVSVPIILDGILQPEVIPTPILTPMSGPIQIQPPPPVFGCLKGGMLPTRSQFTTVKNVHALSQPSLPTIPTAVPTIAYPAPNLVVPHTPVPNAFVTGGKPSFTQTKTAEMLEKIEKKNAIKQRIRVMKQKKILKRTYRVGRSRVAPKVSVLISNKTIRNKIASQVNELKQTPIQDVRKYLIQKGLIKVGSITPNDVLRKMYESVNLVCGEIQNHNPETLLYNFLKDT